MSEPEPNTAGHRVVVDGDSTDSTSNTDGIGEKGVGEGIIPVGIDLMRDLDDNKVLYVKALWEKMKDERHVESLDEECQNGEQVCCHQSLHEVHQRVDAPA